MRAQDNTDGVARPIVVRVFLWLAPTFLWRYEVIVSHADVGGSPQRHNHSRPSCNQDDACLDAIPFGRSNTNASPRYCPSTAEAQKAQKPSDLPRKLLRRTV